MTEIPDHLRRFLPERSEPTPAEQFDAWLEENAPPPRPKRTNHRAPQGRLRIWISMSLTLGMLAAVCVGIAANVMR